VELEIVEIDESLASFGSMPTRGAGGTAKAPKKKKATKKRPAKRRPAKKR